MKIKSKVAKFTGERKIVEIPKSIRDNFNIGHSVFFIVNKKEIIIKKQKRNKKLRRIIN